MTLAFVSILQLVTHLLQHLLQRSLAFGLLLALTLKTLLLSITEPTLKSTHHHEHGVHHHRLYELFSVQWLRPTSCKAVADLLVVLEIHLLAFSAAIRPPLALATDL